MSSEGEAGRIGGQTVSVGDEAYCPTCDESFDITTESCPKDGTRLVSFVEPDDELIGEALDDRFLIDAKIGAGGMGTVYRARQSSIGRDVAIKVIHPSRTRNRGAAKRFLREARLASKLTHPNTVVVHDVGQSHSGALYIAMELVDGQTLREAIRDRGSLSLADAVGIAAQLCDALAAAHKIGIIHRDLKPSNVMLVDGVVKVLDFGLAKSLAGDASTTDLTDSNEIMGTPAYISPEMVRGEPLDARSDLYSLGCVLYEMIAGEPPFHATTTAAALTRHLEDTPPPLEAPPGIAALVASMLAKRPDDRPPSAAAVKRALLEATAPPPPEPIEQPARASGAWVAWLAIGIIFAGGASFAIWSATSNGDGEQAAKGAVDAAVTVEAPEDLVDAPEPPIDGHGLPAIVEFEITPASARVKLSNGDEVGGRGVASSYPGFEGVTAVISAPGYHSETVELRDDTLVKLELRRKRRAPRVGRDAGSSGPPTVPFKVD